ncbi:hypothetical protein E4U56_007919 [Claviceps arundinis]|uniref:Uncharacterized protein n=1 Tax=Claviceps arundinis TaxID=1623583 RepID=A0A9P7MU81_9HYPO|nr:hypothetical protein E4U56_007919 [Claviceps arundinis]
MESDPRAYSSSLSIAKVIDQDLVINPIMGDKVGAELQPYCQSPSSLRSKPSLDMVELDLQSGLQLSISQRVEAKGRQNGRELYGFWMPRGIASCDKKLTAATSIERTDQQVIPISTPFSVD